MEPDEPASTELPSSEPASSEPASTESTSSEVFSREEYSRPSFWNDRFRENSKAFDWYVTWKELRKFLLILTHHEDYPLVLMVGCGSSTLSQDMGQSGYHVINIDLSDVVLERMSSASSQDFLQMDATHCPFRDQSFDLVLDKGTFDALACSSGSPLPDQVIGEMGRIAKGAVVIITHGKPEMREARFRRALEQHGVWKGRALQCELSMVAQFINIMRAKFPDKSLASIMKDKASLAAAVAEMAAYVQNRTTEATSEKRQSHCWLYFFFRQTDAQVPPVST